ncbi:hypothetical protein PUR71_29085 [Streptomyces sp. SP17BM10]|uniref:hypothetical protein n=1 Tax=Streptomyces sp. SP17BM10 TaxID=3002530 RepID=UPI002E7A8C71|nr:hypothetical protein [Streptomyces sp. SP17BM10]MEE1786928.1 hypothetical protein [Streptomyces sp. SP17BM10]
MAFVRTIESALTDELPDGESPVAGRPIYQALRQRGLAFEPIHTGGGYFALSLLIPGGEILITDDDGQIARPAEFHTAWLACFYPEPTSPFDPNEEDVMDIYLGDGSLSLADDTAACTETVARWLTKRHAATSTGPLPARLEIEAAAPVARRALTLAT